MRIENYDLVVLGGGAAGTMAAIAAAKKGVKTLIIEAGNCLGGTRTAGAVDTFYGFFSTLPSQDRIVGGLSWQVVERLYAQNACFERQNSYGAGKGITYDLEALKRVLDEMICEAGIDVLFGVVAFNADYTDSLDGKKVRSIDIATKRGVIKVSAKVFIDASGDADLIYWCDGEFCPLEDGETMQSLTTIFCVGNVDMQEAGKISSKELSELMHKAAERGMKLPRLDGSFHKTTGKGVVQANMVRIGNVDATDPWEVSKAEIEGRRQMKEYLDFLKQYVPGFSESYLVGVSQHIGVRETRRILGEYVLTERDVVEASKFDDAVVCCSAPIEEHHAGRDTRWARVQGDGIYHIPYRSLKPKGFVNVLAVGRCLSATHKAQASARSTAQVMGMGEAAGVAAAIAIDQGIELNKVRFDDIKLALLANGVML